MAGIVGSIASNASDWPYITIPGYESISTNLIETSNGREMGLCPIVRDDQVARFEEFAYNYFYYDRDPPFDNQTALKPPFGKGIWGKDANGNFTHMTTGNVSYPSPNQDILTPILQHNAGPHPALMINLRFEETRGDAIDDVIACSQDRKKKMQNMHMTTTEDGDVVTTRSKTIEATSSTTTTTAAIDELECGTITDMLILTSQDVEPGPGALIFSPIYPDKDPTEVMLGRHFVVYQTSII
jgi:hypothetical protein